MTFQKFFAVAALSTAVCGSAWAQSNKAPGTGPNPFTDCGIGAALFKDVHWAAVTSNVIWDLGTTAVTSATASPETCSGRKVAAAAFINDTYDRVAEDTAKGRGEHLSTALNLMACDTARQPAAVAQARAQMRQVAASPDHAALSRVGKAEQLYITLDAAVSQRCGA